MMGWPRDKVAEWLLGKGNGERAGGRQGLAILRCC
jgi:hypothetical protein